MLNWILIIIVGGVLGWLASIVMRTDAQQGILLNIVVGIVGAPRRPGACSDAGGGIDHHGRFLASNLR